jgi:hypothetical protein
MNLIQILIWLIDQWCERRSLRPLRFILRAYPAPLVHTDNFGDLLDALKDVKGLCREEPTNDELSHVISSINELEDYIEKRLRS